MSDQVRQQIADILAAKAAFSAAQKKVNANLLFQAKSARGDLAATSFASAIGAATSDAQGRVEVDISGDANQIVSRVQALGGTVLSSFPRYNAVRASMPLQNVEALAGDASVRAVSPADQMQLSVGALTSQGYISHKAKEVVTNVGLTGAGVKVGVLSDSATAARITALQGTGDLGPGTSVIPGQNSTGTDEGTAMMEIVQDLAPGAQIYFATANGGQAQFATNIAALAAAGCKIIVDDVSYFAEAAFQDGTVAQAVNTFVAGGGLYFSSAANSGNLTNGTSGTWEGDFLSGGAITGPIATAGETGLVHNFGTAGSPQNFNVLTTASRNISLKWSDPLGASTNDYDVFILNAAGTTLKGFSAAVQNGTQDPVEFVQLPASGGNSAATNDQVVVVLFSGATRALRVDTHRGVLSIKTDGSTYGHNGGPNTVTVAAVGWNSAKTGTKPFVGGAANPTETFSSDGPRKMFYNSNGTPITPGNLLFATSGGTTFAKPDISAADGVSTKTPGFNPFFGTSAAAPHAAGIAALVWSANPSLTNAQVLACMKNTALDIRAPGVDRDSGSGIVMALAAVQACQQQ
jgi:subtilisin family serine protease